METRYSRSIELFKSGKALLPGGVSSPGRAFAEVETPALCLVSGHGAYVTDADGNRYVDFVNGLGPLILGHTPEAVSRAIAEQARRGTVFATPTEVEYTLAGRIIGSTACVEQLRFTCSGTEAVMSAVRVAKGYTGRPGIVKFNGGYHGHADALLGRGTKRHMRGGDARIHNGLDTFILDNTYMADYNDLGQVEAILAEHGPEIAAVVVEPCATNMGVVRPLPGFLAGLRGACDQAGALLIFDEVVSGFRFRFGGLSGEGGVEPDLVTFGKIIGGGTPIGAYGGRARYLEPLETIGGVFQGGTFAGNPLSMAAGLAALEVIGQPGFYEGLEQRGQLVERELIGGFRREGLPYTVQRRGSLFSLVLIPGRDRLVNLADVEQQDVRTFSALHREMARRGYLMAPTIEEPVFLSNAHTEAELTAFAASVVEILGELLRASSGRA